MGLENNTRATFLSIGDGKVTKRVKQPTEKSVERTTKEGKVIHEEVYDSITGFITDIKTADHPQYGRFWNITLQDGVDTYILQMNYSGGYSSAFLKILPNVDFRKKVKITPTMKVIDGKKKVGLFINQNGAALKHYYNKENPNGLPPLEKIKTKKQGRLVEEWNDNAMMEFLEDMVNNEILPKMKQQPQQTSDAIEVEVEDMGEEGEPEKDLPF